MKPNRSQHQQLLWLFATPEKYRVVPNLPAKNQAEEFHGIPVTRPSLRSFKLLVSLGWAKEEAGVCSLTPEGFIEAKKAR